MTRRYDDLVDVRRRDDVPAEFLWHGRLYVVREVLDHWVEAGAWWSGSAAQALLGTSSVGTSSVGADSRDAFGEQSAGSLAIDDGEREIWRVEAGAGRFAGTGVFDLCADWSTGTWFLTRVLD